MSIRCELCDNWLRHRFYPYGQCIIRFGNQVEFSVRSGWDGCEIEDVTTDEDFYCAAFEPKARGEE